MKKLIFTAILAASLVGCARYVHRRPVEGGEEVAKVTLWFQAASAGKVASTVKDGDYERVVGVDEAGTDMTGQVAEVLRGVADGLAGAR